MKRFVAMLLIVGMFLCSETPFVFAAGDKGYVAQDDSYRPREDDYATREEAVAGFVKAMGEEEPAADIGVLKQFKDAGKIASAYTREIAAAVSAQMVTGYADGTFRPQSPITRTEALVILDRVLAVRTLPQLAAVEFSDTPEWAETAVNRLAAAGVVKGYGNGILGAEDLLTGEQVSILAERAERMLGPAGDFYEYINQDWLRDTEIPDGQPAWSDTNEIVRNLMKQIGEIVYSLYREKYKEHKSFPQGSSEQKVADVFAAASNTVYRDKLGLAPVKEYLERIDRVETMEDLLVCMAYLEKNGFHGLLPVAVTVDAYDSSKYVLSCSEVYTGMNVSMVQGAEPEKVISAYKDYLKNLFVLFGETEDRAAERSDEVAALCAELAKASMSMAEHNQVEHHFTVYDFKELKKRFPNLNAEKFVKELGLPTKNGMVVYDLPLAEKVNAVFKKENLELLKDYLRASVMDGSALYLNSEAFLVWRGYQDVLNGTESGVLPADYAVSMVEELLGWDLAKLYVERYASSEDKKKVEEMTATILEGYKARLQKNTWMRPESRKAALRKLEKLRVRVGYPEDIDRYPDTEFTIPSIRDGGSLLAYRTAFCNRYFEAGAEALSDEEAAADKEVWGMLPQTVNAMYDPSSNSITIPAGILQPPFYDAKASFETNLGGIGTVIAHEISHALDSLGSKFDENGNLKNWWQAEDKTAFEKICQRVVDAYEEIPALDGMTVDGKQTLGENLADLAGMTCILDIVGEGNPRLDQLFSNYARTWRMKCTDDYAKMLLQVDSHAPDKVRVNRVLSNFDRFGEFYGVQPGDGMYLPETERIQIWNRGIR